MHLNPPVPPQVSEFSMAHVGPSGKEVSSRECLSQGGRIRSKETQDVPPAAHIPKPRAGVASHRKDSTQISRARMPSGLLEAKDDSEAKEALNSPFALKIQNIWDNCIKTFTTNPFRKISARGQEEDKGIIPRQQNKEDKKNVHVGTSGELDGTEEVVPECVTGKALWDFPTTMQGFRTLNPSHNSDTSYLQNTLLRAGVRESFREAKAYGFRKGEADQENDSIKPRNIPKEDKSIPMISENENYKTGQSGTYTQGHEVKQTQKSLVDMLSKADNSELEISNLDGHTGHTSSLHMNQGSATHQLGVDLSKGKQVQGLHDGTKIPPVDLMEADTSQGDATAILTDNNHKEPVNDEMCWVHRWLASYSVSQELPETVVANCSGRGSGTIQKNVDGMRLEDDDNWVARWLKSYREAC